MNTNANTGANTGANTQEAARNYVQQHINGNVSALIAPLMSNYEAACNVYGAEEIEELCQMPIDYEGLLSEQIRNYDLGELRAVVESSTIGEDFDELIRAVVEECFTGRLKTKNLAEELRSAVLCKALELTREGQCDLVEELGLDIDDWQQDVYEWYDVSFTLGSHLMAKGEKVVSFYGLRLWGRTCTGQAVYMDGVIEDIVRELGM
jgi:hypothetical protein